METPTTTEKPTGRNYPSPFTRTLADILDDLSKPIPQRLIKQKNTGKFKADYVHHTSIRDLLDFYAPGWMWSAKINAHDGKMYVVGTLTLYGLNNDGDVVAISRDGIGNEDSNLDGFGDPSSNAHAQALRRAAMEFGLGRDLWRK